MKNVWSLCLMMASFLLCLCAFGADEIVPPVFPAHPCLAYTADELAQWKADPGRQEEMKQAIARGDALLAHDLVIPQKEGQWIFYYSCPKDDAQLVAETPERHVCPNCKAVYTDERTCAAYRTLLFYQLDNNCLALATSYALTGNERYAAPVRSAMLELARLYPTFERHDRWGRRGMMAVVGGRRYCQLLDEAVGDITLARAYDLIYTSTALTAEDHKTIEEKLLGSIAWEIHRYQSFAGSKNNHQTWFNACYAVVGVATGDEKLLRESIYGANGLRWQLVNSVTSDGIWYEGTMAYHFYALQAIMDTLGAAKRAGWDLSKDAVVKSLWLGPIQLAYPNGQFPVIHDSDPVSLGGYQVAYRWALDYFHDPVFAIYAGEKGAATPAPLSSANLTGIGLAALRRGVDKDAVCAMIDYGQHGDHHGHPDKLNLVLYGLGRELLLDPGRISYSVPEYNTWCRTTVAHNTVVVNGKDQQPDTGRCLYFTDNADYCATFTASDGAYTGIALRRFMLLTGSLLIDVYTVKGNQPAQYDWLAHGHGVLETALPLQARATPLGAENGYQHLTQLKEGSGQAPSIFTLSNPPGLPCKIWCLGDENTTVVTGIGIGYNLTDKVPFLLRRRTATSTTFVTVYDLSGDGSAVTGIESVPVKLAKGNPATETEGIGLRIHSAKGTLLVGLDLRDKMEKQLSVNGAAFERCLVKK